MFKFNKMINLELRCVKILFILCKEAINVYKCDFGDNTFYFMLVTELLHKISFERVEWVMGRVSVEELKFKFTKHDSSSVIQ